MMCSPLRKDNSSVERVVCNQLRERFDSRSKHVVMKLDHRKGVRGLTLFSHPHRHFAFNGETAMHRGRDRRARGVQFALKKEAADRPAQSELFSNLRPDTPNLITSD
jgi:hypothetical protein